MSTNFGDPFTAFVMGRRQKEQRVFQQRDKTLEFLEKMSQQVSPEYHDTMAGIMAQVMGASGDKKGQKQIEDALSQIHQLTQGIGGQTKTTDFSGYQGAGTQNNATPTPPTASPVSDNISATMSNPSLSTAPTPNPIDMMMNRGAGASPFAAKVSQPPMQGSSVPLTGNDDIQGGNLMAQPPAGGVALVNAPKPGQLMSPGTARPGFQVKGQIPLIEDLVARKLREQQALQPGVLELYQGKTSFANAQKIAQIRAKGEEDTRRLLAGIDKRYSDQMFNYINRDANREAAGLISSGMDPEEAHRTAWENQQADLQQKREYADERTQRLRDLGDEANRRLTDMERGLKVREDDLELRRIKEANSQGWKQDKASHDQQKRDIAVLRRRVESAQKEVDRIGKDPRMYAPDKYPNVQQQFSEAQQNLTKVLDDLQSTSEGKPGESIAAREAAVPVAASGKGPKLATGQGVGETVKVGGKDVKITKIYPDGKRFDYEAIP